MLSQQLSIMVKEVVISRRRLEKMFTLKAPEALIENAKAILEKRERNVDSLVFSHRIPTEEIKALESFWEREEDNMEKAERLYEGMPLGRELEKIRNEVNSLFETLLKSEGREDEINEAANRFDFNEVERIQNEVFPKYDELQRLLAKVRRYIIEDLCLKLSVYH